MFLKYVIERMGESPICIKCDIQAKKCIVGGRAGDIEVMQAILKEYFTIENEIEFTVKIYNSSLIRFEIATSYSHFFGAIAKMQEYGVIVKKVKSFGRLMR